MSDAAFHEAVKLLEEFSMGYPPEHHAQVMGRGYANIAEALRKRDRLLASASSALVMRWRHKKRGSIYIEIGRGILQNAISGIDDGQPMVLYRSEEDGSLWCRPTDEFEDGRFEPIYPHADPSDVV